MVLQQIRDSLRSADHDGVRQSLDRVTLRFPQIFGPLLIKGYDRLKANSSATFCENRTEADLAKIIRVEWALGRKIVAERKEYKRLYVKTFLIDGVRHNHQAHKRLSVALVVSEPYIVTQDQVIQAISAHMPGAVEEKHSHILWRHPEKGYLFLYLELCIPKDRPLAVSEQRHLARLLQEQLLASPPLTPTLFWPFNKEESFRRLQHLKKEVNHKKDLPHISIHFQAQHPSYLEFFVHLVRPQKEESIEKTLAKLPPSLHTLCYFQSTTQGASVVEMVGFSIDVPASIFTVHGSINLLYARRYVLRILEITFGPLRDYNGGLFAQQQQHFEAIRIHLESKISHFHLFAEQLFYALHPAETWLLLSLDEAEELFMAFSELIRDPSSFSIRSFPNRFTLIKTFHAADCKQKIRRLLSLDGSSYAQIMIGDFYYLCFFGTAASEALQAATSPQIPSSRVLRLASQEYLTSLNPHHLSNKKAHTFYKLLFEGLIRLDAVGAPQLAGAKSYNVSSDRRTYTFTLKPSCWSNGESVTSFDYVSSIQAALSEKMGHLEPLFQIKNSKLFSVKKCDASDLGIKALDVDTVQFILESDDDRFLYKLAHPFFFPLFGTLREPKWFNGPYLVRNQTSDQMTLEKNPYFEGAHVSPFDQIQVDWIADSRIIFERFVKGMLDWIGDPFSNLELDEIQHLNRAKILCQKPFRRLYLRFNAQHPFLGLSHMHEALSVAIDRNHICSVLIPRGVPIDHFHQDRFKATALMQSVMKMGYSSHAPLSLMFTADSKVKRLASYLVDTWKEVLGIKIIAEALERNAFREKVMNGHYDLCLIDEPIGKEQELALLDEMYVFAHHERLSDFIFDENGIVDLSLTRCKNF